MKLLHKKNQSICKGFRKLYEIVYQVSFDIYFESF